MRGCIFYISYLTYSWNVPEIPLECWDFHVYTCVLLYEQGRGLRKGQFCFELQRKLNTPRDETTFLLCFRTTLPTTSSSRPLIHIKSLPSYLLKISPGCPLAPPYFRLHHISLRQHPLKKICIQSSPYFLHTDGIVIALKHKSDHVILLPKMTKWFPNILGTKAKILNMTQSILLMPRSPASCSTFL